MAIKLDPNFPKFNEKDCNVTQTINSFIEWERSSTGRTLPTFKTEEIVYTDEEQELAYQFLYSVVKHYGLPAEIVSLIGLAERILDAHYQCNLRNVKPKNSNEH